MPNMIIPRNALFDGTGIPLMCLRAGIVLRSMTMVAMFLKTVYLKLTSRSIRLRETG